MNKTLLSFSSWCAVLLSAASIVCVFIYLRQEQGNHTSFEPWLLSTLYLPTFLLGVFTTAKTPSRWAGILASISGLAGLVILWYLDRFNILVQYERWLERGMP